MSIVLTIVLSLVLAEIAVRLPLADTARRLVRIGRKAMRTLGARSVSDHWKERAMLRYARDLMVASAQLAAFLVALVVVAVFLALVLERGFPGFVGFAIGWTGLLVSLMAVTAFLWARRHGVGYHGARPPGAGRHG